MHSRIWQFIKIILKIFIIIILTLLTQIGGVIYLITEVLIQRHNTQYRVKKTILFIFIYSIATFLIVPNMAPIWGRTKIKNSAFIQSHTILTILCNRNYVRIDMNDTLQEIGRTFSRQYPGLQLHYLDANFPFINGFPLPPHLSHNDGKKVDLSLIYKDQNDQLTNNKPSISGYGVHEKPRSNETNQTALCKKRGFWQYDMAKYLTLGTVNKQLKLANTATKDLLLTLVNHQKIGKIFIEPNLKKRLGLYHSKIRFHGCRAVRHDDHIHIQLY